VIIWTDEPILVVVLCPVILSYMLMIEISSNEQPEKQHNINMHWLHVPAGKTYVYNLYM